MVNIRHKVDGKRHSSQFRLREGASFDLVPYLRALFRMAKANLRMAAPGAAEGTVSLGRSVGLRCKADRNDDDVCYLRISPITCANTIPPLDSTRAVHTHLNTHAHQLEFKYHAKGGGSLGNLSRKVGVLHQDVFTLDFI